MAVLPCTTNLSKINFKNASGSTSDGRDLFETYPEVDGEENPLMIPLRLAAQKGDPDAMGNLGIRLSAKTHLFVKRNNIQDRLLVKKLNEEAEYWLAQARLCGDEFAIFQYQRKAEEMWNRRKKNWSDVGNKHDILVHPSKLRSRDTSSDI